MSSITLRICAGMLLGLSTISLEAAQDCAPDRDVQFICGLSSAEDLIAVPGTDWIIASGRVSNTDGMLYAVNREDHSLHVIFPATSLAIRHDMTTYGDCPGPNPGTFQPHGVSIREGTGESHTLYVVGHGQREAIEVFDIDVAKAGPRLTWIGCVIAPTGTRLNSVTALPEDSIAATNFDTAGGEVWQWSPETAWSEVPGSFMAGPNGIVSSPDGRWLYIGGWTDEELVRLSRGRTPLQIDSVRVGFHIDNVRWAEDGHLLVAGQYAAPDVSIGGCLNRGECEGVASRAARIDPENLAERLLVNYASNDKLIFGTVAIQVDDELWVSGIAGGEVIARFPIKGDGGI